jgi:ribosome-binding protein aMBF1 (putative translation factor)
MPESAEEQMVVARVDQSAVYSPAWHLIGNGSPAVERALVRAFQQLVRQTMAVLGRTFEYPGQAVDIWLDSIRKESRHPEAFFMRYCIRLTVQHCDEYITRFVEKRDKSAEKQMRDLKEEFLRLSGEVSAGRLLDQMGAMPEAKAGNGAIPMTKTPWNELLRTAREKAKLSRPALALKLKKAGVHITADAIKKHETGSARPKQATQQGYARLLGISEQIFQP